MDSTPHHQQGIAMSSRKDEKTRINRVITRTGDDGHTGLADGSRVAKDHPRIEALGSLDELNSALGVLRAHPLDEDLDRLIENLQQWLFDIGGELAIPATATLTDAELVEIESQADLINAELPPLKEFVLPGGNADAAWCHHCRTVARRAERRLVTLAAEEEVNPVSLAILNRLGDLLFIMARLINLRAETPESQWIRREDR
ncbi:cob(I)yrinic acid a,c-diamide adenosyltransferase [Alloalcanivorax xenomutans]|jgi:cob(I)alamin adenosyltransferase|uniref:cob(I)yrinic acid a,c-diamide adenosyltransferase n=1 Tax=Alloalcanivorax xenomutans TaxID=1094342 RepID=UPI0003B7F19B|nr:cob(I)yrinic acid a,c-diamide adenosyltransferase [Alloalcanivorax xenomutans]ERS15385.1 ATP--cobalamin adenosyltransferase [Alcanivorax sp. PN-3]WOA30520.1 cob(I)yrinic acid a,c-diamide adenosyltransferase [Alloalcanivorax xenomutans]WOD27398.1 cob(I)yrinic acid a,c-diamide adenosyltransferase [Alloalcanivorax xenomutans]CUR44820.1 Cob(I)alamin adenosyltransferase PduO [Alloalcanivorax xenomutans]|tara:strand:+ start:1149 stop:1754 length:606 start_codon:yes stop_codon:yes gene_type:complete